MRTVYFVLILVLMLLLLSSCAQNKDNGDDIYSSLLSLWTQAEEEPEPNIEKYIAVIPSDCSAEVYNAARELCDKIAENTSAEVKLFYEHEEYKAGNKSCEIIIGNSRRSEKTLKRYKSEDFGYFSEDGVVYIGGQSDTAVLSAIAKFREDVVVYADPEFFINDTTSYFYRAEYDIDKIILNGFELCDYNIVYPKDDSVGCALATEFSKMITEKTGYCLSLKNDKEAQDQALSICIGDTALHTDPTPCEMTDFEIAPYSTGISLFAGNRYGMKTAIEKLSSLLLNKDQSGNVTAEISSVISDEFRCAELNIKQISPSSLQLEREEIVDIHNAICTENTDIVKICGISAESALRISQNLGGGYSMLEIFAGENGIYYFYKNSRVSIKETEIGEKDADLVYVVSDIEFELEFIELFATDPKDTTAAVGAAERCNDIINGSDKGCIVIGSAFRDVADIAFNSTVDKAGRVSALDGSNGDRSDPYFYICGDSFEVSEYSGVTPESFGENIDITLEIYKIDK